MKKINDVYLDKLVSKLLSETLEEKADNLISKIKKEVEETTHKDISTMTDEEIDNLMKKEVKHSKSEMDEEKSGECSECGGMMSEGECTECGYKMESIYHRDEDELPPVMDVEEGLYDVSGKFPKKQSFDYVQEEESTEDDEVVSPEFCKAHQEKFESGELGTKELEYFKERYGNKCEFIGEELIGGQKKLDKNKNGKIDAEDFEMLRKSKKKGGETEEQWQSVAADMAVAAAPVIAAKVMDKLSESKKKKGGFPDLSGDGKVTRKDILLGRGVKLKDKELDEKWEGDVEVEKTGEYGDMTIGELNTAIKKLKEKNERTKEAGKKVPHADRTKMSQLYFAKRAKQGWKGEGSAEVKESISLTESELIDLIEKIVLEQKVGMKTLGKPKGLTKYEQVHKADGKENDDYLKLVTKKMKDYLKTGSKGDYEMNPKHFPKGNGELEEMKKKAYIPSGAVQDYVDNFTAAALENINYDEIEPNEDWVSDNVKGSSRTGNNPEWANSVDTGVNKKRDEIRKKNLLGKIKKKAYNKSAQPVTRDKAGEGEGDKIMAKLESVEPKTEKKLNEEFERMKNLITYSQKTQ